MKSFYFVLFAFIQFFGSESFSVIYGKDNRQDINQVSNLRKLAKATAVTVAKDFFVLNPDKTLHIDPIDKMSDFICSNERFSQQTSTGVCTGFLISDRLLVTAGHCLLPNGIIDNEKAPFCESFNWYFDYNLAADPTGQFNKINQDLVYSCKRVIRAENLDHGLSGSSRNDFALIELDRPVVGIEPLKLSTKATKINDIVFTIGHPSGMPAKFSGNSVVIDNSNPFFYSANLDTQGGNSGGPVFNVNNEIVGILVSGHSVDYYDDVNNKCQRANICSEDGSKCKQQPYFSGQQTSNYIQKIEALINYLNK